MRVIESGALNIVPADELKKKLERGVPLNIKLGVDPTSPDLHLGHAVPPRKMRQFQDLGHRVTLIIGSGTAVVGDPSGKNSTRPQLTPDEVMANAKTYVEQAQKILDPNKTDIVYNGDWILSLNLEDMLGLMSKFTVARILERDDFSNRYKSQTPIALHEFIYPVLQAYDSVMIKADVEMGGNDQLFNLLAGRDLMEKSGMEPQVALTMPLLEGTDGVRKMSKSYGNYVGLTDEPADMFGKIMSIPDELVPKYWRLCSTLDLDEVEKIDAAFADGTADPYASKRALGHNIVALYHSEEAAVAAEKSFDLQFKQHQIPDDIPELSLDLTPGDDGTLYVPRIMVDAKLANTASEARRLIDGGGVRVDGVKLEPKSYNVDPSVITPGKVLQAGKRKFARLV